MAMRSVNKFWEWLASWTENCCMCNVQICI